MADISEPQSGFLLRPRGSWVFGAISDALASLGAACEAARTVDELGALSDAELAARGMARKDIARVAAQAILKR